MRLTGKYEQSKRLSPVNLCQEDRGRVRCRKQEDCRRRNQKKRRSRDARRRGENEVVANTGGEWNSAEYKGCVYYTEYVYTWRKTPWDQSWSKGSHCHVDNMQTHIPTEERKDIELVLPSGGHLWPFGTVVGDDASQTAQRRASRANRVFECAYVCVCVYTGVWTHTGQSHPCQNIWANESKVWQCWQGLMFSPFAPCQYACMLAFSCICISVLAFMPMCLSVFECCHADWGLKTM